MVEWSDGYWMSKDGLRLHYRDHPGDTIRPPILCIPGLTRNARDFEGVAERLAGDWRVICVDLRGRGESAYAKDPMSYVPLTYHDDLSRLLAELDADRLILFGTSLGGFLTMLLGTTHRDRIAGCLLNDIGPVIEERGIEFIRSYVGRARDWPTWLHAARFFADTQKARYPHWDLDQWLVFAKRTCKLTSNGRIVLDYDMRIAEPFKEPVDANVDLWAAYSGLRGIPGLLLRGELSDLLSEETMARMLAENDAMQGVTVSGVGHAPTLDEPEAVEATGRLLDRVLAAEKARRT